MKRYSIPLSTRGLDNLISILENEKIAYKKKFERFMNALTDLFVQNAKFLFDHSVLSVSYDLSESRRANVKIEKRVDGSSIFIFAMGEDAVFVEFGAGVFFNSTDNHPYREKLGFTIGEYGQKKGQRMVWAYYDRYDGFELKLTRGTDASKPMYTSLKNISLVIDKLIFEVFGA